MRMKNKPYSINENADFFRMQSIHCDLLALQKKTICASDNECAVAIIWTCELIMQRRDKDRTLI